ncbi:MAG: ATP synthase F1 subunit gamma [Actinomycetota bacterium]|nr:ATP synthase F1 subunit gamma [Actinomycetota bacterium]
MNESKPFFNKIEDFIYNLGFCKQLLDDRLVRPRTDEKTVLVMGITSDRGLCGSYNTDIIDVVEEVKARAENQGKKVLLDIIGTKGKNYFQYRGQKLSHVYENLSVWPKFMDAREISREIISRYVVGEVDRVLICYTKFVSTSHHQPTTVQILPIPIAERMDQADQAAYGIDEVMIDNRICRITPDFIYEPDLVSLIRSLVPGQIFTYVYGLLLESTASELGSRMVAMDKARENSDELLDELDKEYHRTRQHQITSEIIEVISGAEDYGQEGVRDE